MKPLGKIMKAAYYNNTDKEEALKQLLISYRSTPHPATGEPPGAIVFRNGYNSDFPRRAIDDEAAEAAFQLDNNKKSSHGHNVNSSKHRKKSSYAIGDKVYIRNHIRSKFQPLFGPETFKFISLGNGGAIVEKEKDRTTYRRHLDDIKLAPCEEMHRGKSNSTQEESNILWFPKYAGKQPIPAAETINEGIIAEGINEGIIVEGINEGIIAEGNNEESSQKETIGTQHPQGDREGM